MHIFISVSTCIQMYTRILHLILTLKTIEMAINHTTYLSGTLTYIFSFIYNKNPIFYYFYSFNTCENWSFVTCPTVTLRKWEADIGTEQFASSGQWQWGNSLRMRAFIIPLIHDILTKYDLRNKDKQKI